ncbi:cupin-like domain-containing protein [Ideonella sp. DXS29W]|uniref:Cupin-like domain-containing protein n=1 Tax=Ideonella lacteola TaxID=2984193 RepID=A0ABU9BXV4_9BURK
MALTDVTWPSAAGRGATGPLALSGLVRPMVLRGAAAEWPAVRRWSFDALADGVPDQPVTLVVGNRERGTTRLRQGSLRDYLDCLALQAAVDARAPAEDVVYQLKEFDLLRAHPALRQDLRWQELARPRWSVVSHGMWIGPAGARTGLHRDLLDNLAVLLLGRKRFFLLPPGRVEALGAVSDKYDRWAVLARVGAEALAGGGAAEAIQVVDLAPGDALYLPRGWWHEVVNLTPSVLLGGFFGPVPRVVSLWAWTGLRQACHLAGWRRGRCCCHADQGDQPAA